jgi:hypothetical protein
MKIGFILECQPKGPDADIYPYLANVFCPGLELEKPETLVNKANVMNDGPEVAKILLESGCDYVFIIWDRMPKWGGTGRCEDHITTVEAGLTELKVDRTKIVLCCISEMLESWLIADGRGINNWLAAKTNRDIRKFDDHATEAEQTAPKERIKRYLGEHFPKWKYNDYQDNFAIVKQFPDFERAARRNNSFAHFKENIERVCSER